MAAVLEENEAGTKGLKVGALGLASAIVIGVASTAPGYSLAAGLGGVVSEVGTQAPAIIWMAFIPMFFIASAYKYMNKVDPDCGTTFTWVTRSVGPKAGWIASWGLIMADLVIMPNLAGISGQYLFLLIGQPGWAENRWAVLFVGVLFILAMTWICVIGIELNAKTQMGLLAAEVVVLVIFAVVALAKSNITPSLSWLNPLEIKNPDGSMNWTGLAAGINLSLFIYWGWDTAVAVNEECADADKTPGRAAVISTLILVANYVVVSFAVISVASVASLSESYDVLETGAATVFGDEGFGPFMLKLLIIAVLSSAAASCQTTILPAARSTLSMGVHKALPARFAETHPRFLTPTFSTWLFGGIAVAWFVFLVLVSGADWQGDNSPYVLSIAAVGLMIAFYYGATGYAAVIYFWRHLFKSAKAFFLVGVSSLIGAGILTWSFVTSLIDDEFGNLTKIGMGLLLLGVPLMFLCRNIDGGSFFRILPDPPEVRPDPLGTGVHSPELGTYRKDA